MPLAKLTCPKCLATLKPAKPVPEGKLIKCPKCEETFKAGQTAKDTSTKAAPARAEEAKKPAAVPGKPVYDESVEESEGTYAVVRDEEAERKLAEKEERIQRRKKRKRAKERGEELDEEDEDEEKDDEFLEEDEDPTAQYLRNLKPNDPRGATQETIVSPANWLLRTSLVGFFGWVFYFVAFMLPVLFPNKDEGGPATVSASGKAKFKFNDKVLEAIQDADLDKLAFGKVKSYKDREFEGYDDFLKQVTKGLNADDVAKVKNVTKKFGGKKDKYTHWWSAETILDEDYEPWSVLLFIFVMILGMVQSGVIAMGSVKMQSLESYRWALTGCIVAIVPLITFPLFMFITFLFDLSDMLLEGDWSPYSWMLGLVAFAWGPIVGGLCLKQFLSPQVKPGFEYKPD